MSLIGTVYFWKISKHWQGIEVYAATLGFIALVGAWVMPESPKYLITMKKYDEARKAITFIAKVNGRKEPFTDRFDREVADRINPIIIN